MCQLEEGEHLCSRYWLSKHPRNLTTAALRHVQEIADGGGVSAVLAVLRCHMGAPAVARAASGLLRQLANNDDNKDAIVQGGGMELLCAAAANHPTDAGILEQVSLQPPLLKKRPLSLNYPQCTTWLNPEPYHLNPTIISSLQIPPGYCTALCSSAVCPAELCDVL